MLLSEILQRLKQPIPRDRISSKPVGKGANKKDVSYIKWVALVQLLDERAPGRWEWQIVSTSQLGDRLVMVGRLTIIGDDAKRSMDASGSEELSCSDYGDPASNSEAMCLRRACSKFGLGLELREEVSEAHPGGRTDQRIA